MSTTRSALQILGEIRDGQLVLEHIKKGVKDAPVVFGKAG